MCGDRPCKSCQSKKCGEPVKRPEPCVKGCRPRGLEQKLITLSGLEAKESEIARRVREASGQVRAEIAKLPPAERIPFIEPALIIRNGFEDLAELKPQIDAVIADLIVQSNYCSKEDQKEDGIIGWILS